MAERNSHDDEYSNLTEEWQKDFVRQLADAFRKGIESSELWREITKTDTRQSEEAVHRRTQRYDGSYDNSPEAIRARGWVSERGPMGTRPGWVPSDAPVGSVSPSTPRIQRWDAQPTMTPGQLREAPPPSAIVQGKASPLSGIRGIRKGPPTPRKS